MLVFHTVTFDRTRRTLLRHGSTPLYDGWYVVMGAAGVSTSPTTPTRPDQTRPGPTAFQTLKYSNEIQW